MKKLKMLAALLSLLLLASLLAPSLGAYAMTAEDKETQAKTGQPFASYWFPDELLKWSPKTDPDAPFNKGTIPLKKRVTSAKSNATQTSKGELMSLDIINQHTAGTPSQGFKSIQVYNPTQWQYVDVLVAWAGSSGEGIIIPPSADTIDMAHKNGVPVVGTVFFPPNVYGGKTEWVKQFITKDANGRYPVADKLLEVANYYGFDGWFINQETTGFTAADSVAMQNVLKYMQAKKGANQQIIWYDSMTTTGEIDWQGALNEKNSPFLMQNKKAVSNGMFIDFRWNPDRLVASNKNAPALGVNPHKLYAGVDVQSNGYNSNVNWGAIFPPAGQAPIVSLGLYIPGWVYYNSSSEADFAAKENKFWNGNKVDPRYPENVTGAKDWQGIAKYFPEKSGISALPLKTNFNTGKGTFFNKNGVRLQTGEWNQRGMQDVMPTYRFILDNKGGNKLAASIASDDAYTGASSLLLSGNTVKNGTTTTKLFATDVKVKRDTTFSMKVKGTGNTHKLVLQFAGEKNPRKVALKASGTGWVNWATTLSPYYGKTIKEISLETTATAAQSNAKIRIGEIALQGKTDIGYVGAVKNVKVAEKVTPERKTNARITWDKALGNVRYYEIYQKNAKGAQELIGTTPSSAFFATDVYPVKGKAQITVKAVGY
ncbi:endo-beta-N-acetylglucosaminidase [Listeria newyorkensis]|uniref:Endo-beta-N-acetylglucosaminidase n=1 Tax=Listeria newyorkensis TaxID=1497681 RepID=A0A841Z1W7_9LIST|nr:endo-beta-N-acetylglucosaminidase [Listeria newyorkensis]MBC1458833.1 endo-beta-N-acetylglucosaminidase [Listeria newyorkensis]